MSLNVQRVLQDHLVVWGGNPGMNAVYSELCALNAEIDLQVQKQFTVSKGATIDKRIAASNMIDITQRVQGVVTAYASVIGNFTLMSRVKKSRRDIQRMRDSLVGEFCQSVYEIALPLATPLSGYGLKAHDLSGLLAAIHAYRVALPSPRIIQGEESVATAMLVSNLAQLDVILKERLDGLLELYKVEHPEFYGRYKGMRRIVDNG